MVERKIKKQLLKNISFFPAVAILGPRQVGKTTLVKGLQGELQKPLEYFDLENPQVLRRFEGDPTLSIESLRSKTVIFDEIHRLPNIFPLLRGEIDWHREAGRFIFLGSASFDLLKNTSESLAGRISYLEMRPLLFSELDASSQENFLNTHWFRGGFPTAFLAPDTELWYQWFSSFVSTYLEKDLPQLGMITEPKQMGRLLTMLSYQSGNLLNNSNLSKSLGVSVTKTIQQIDFLEKTLLVRRLEPFHTNIKKRLVKTPKLYIRDSGMLHFLLRIPNYDALLGHPLSGNSWEGYVIEQIISKLSWLDVPYFYRTADGSELDLVIVNGNDVRLAIEIKLSNAPKISRGNTVALEDLKNPPFLIVTPSADDYLIRENAWVCGMKTLDENLDRLLG